MAAEHNWALLPSVIIVEILSYISRRDRLKASSVCKRWRTCLFHPFLWSRLVYELDGSDRRKARFLADRCGRFVRETVVKFNAHNIADVKECAKILQTVAINKNTKCFTFKPSSCHIDWPDTQREHIIDRILDSIETIIQSSRKLRHFSLGCVEELLEHSNTFLCLLTKFHSETMESLHLASVKEDVEHYGIIDLDPGLFTHFQSLRHLSIDFDFLTNHLLESFLETRKAKLETLCIHIHGIDPAYEKITNQTWLNLKNHCPNLEVTLNLIHSFEGVNCLLDVLQPSLPLTHLRQFFCCNLNMAAITYISTYFYNTLKSVHILDGVFDDNPGVYESNTDEDPFVMLAWKCHKLEDFTLIGYEIMEDNVIAIARLRKLKTLNIPLSFISTLDEEDETIWAMYGIAGQVFSQKVSDSLGRDWQPMALCDLHPAVMDEHADAESAYMGILLQDQHWDSGQAGSNAFRRPPTIG